MKDQRVHILTSWWCTNDCVFCMDDKTLRDFITIEKVTNDLKDGLKYSKEVTFTSWEPTIHPKIIEMVSVAKKLWYKVIQIISNWRKYKDIKFVQDLIDAWITDFIISIHWYNSLLHDSIVRKKWVFDDVVKWMINISKLKNKHNLVLNTNTTIIKQNYKEIYKIIHFLEKFPINSIVLNVVIPQEEAFRNKNDILVEYSKMAEEFKSILDFQTKYNNIFINGFPYCLWKELHSIMWFREPVQFEQWWVNFARHSEVHDLTLLDKKFDVDMINGKLKRNECKPCKYYDCCEWVRESYIWLYWWGEFNPILN